jgi:hypothetical protein
MSDDNEANYNEQQDKEEVSSISVGRDYRTPKHAGMSGTFQISCINNNENHDDLTDKVDQGLHFIDENECNVYLRKIFRKNINTNYIDEVST